MRVWLVVVMARSLGGVDDPGEEGFPGGGQGGPGGAGGPEDSGGGGVGDSEDAGGVPGGGVVVGAAGVMSQSGGLGFPGAAVLVGEDRDQGLRLGLPGGCQQFSGGGELRFGVQVGQVSRRGRLDRLDKLGRLAGARLGVGGAAGGGAVVVPSPVLVRVLPVQLLLVLHVTHAIDDL